ncbi:MAG: hypothetical protein IJD93_09390 [Ruminococcus sp.]|nr:hypothetical protein [Ruminococcus sp.]
MKKLLALFLALMMCLSFTACKDKDTDTGTDTVVASHLSDSELELELRFLIESNLDCYFLFYVAPLNHTTQQNSDGYYGTDGSFLSTYAALEDLVYSTYAKDKAEDLMNYPSEQEPLYKDSNGNIFVKPDVITPVDYNILWEDDYTITFTDRTDKNCSFVLNTVDLDGNAYETEGSAVIENNRWLLEDLIY